MDCAYKRGVQDSEVMRTRYVPNVRIRQGMLGMVPWLDLLLVMLFLIMLQSRIVLQPGMVVELPEGPSQPGLYSSLIAVAVVSGPASSPVAAVYFANELYRMDDPVRMDALRDALVVRRLRHGDNALTLYADRRVESRHLTQLMQMAQDAGMLRINLGTRPETAGP